MYQELSEVLTGIIILMAMFMAAGWRVGLSRIVQLRLERDAANAAVTQVGGIADQLADQARLHQRRASEFFGIIEGVEKERDLWQRLYRESSQMAGAAQAWLTRDIGRVIQVGNRYAARLREQGEKAPAIDIDPQLKQVVEDFAETHAKGHPEIVSTDATALAKAVDGPPSGVRSDG